MNDYMAGNWWLILFQGILLLLFGVFALAWPGLTLAVFVVGFATYLLANGIMLAIVSFGSIGKVNTWFLWLLVAALEIGLGVYAFKHLGITAGTLLLLLGLMLVVRGVQQIISAFGDGYESRHKILFTIGGLLSLIAGIIVWVYPGSSALAVAWVIGVYGIVVGCMLVAVSLEYRSLAGEVTSGGRGPRPVRP